MICWRKKERVLMQVPGRGRAVQALSRMQKEVEIHGENDHFSVTLDLSC